MTTLEKRVREEKADKKTWKAEKSVFERIPTMCLNALLAIRNVDFGR